MIYLDHSATTPVRKEVVEAMAPFWSERYGNPSSAHPMGREARKSMDLARKQVADLINATPDEIFFTSGGTEADNLALLGAAWGNWKKGRHVITTAIEHSAVLEPCRFLESQGYDLSILPVNEYGQIDMDELSRTIRPDTVLISVMHANNEIGTIQAVDEIGQVATERGIIFHCDAVQSAGHIPVNVNEIQCDLLSISAHKMYGPKGIGCLYIRRGTKIEPLMRGGGHETGLRSGTENVAGIVGFGMAAQLAGDEMDHCAWYLGLLRDRLIEGMLERAIGCQLNGHRFLRLPGHASFSFRGVDGKALLDMLGDKEIYASSGSACHAGSGKPSHVLKAMGYSEELATDVLRITLGRENRDEEIDYLLAIIPEMISGLHDVMPDYHIEKSCPCEKQQPEPM
ncbi:MAG: cysteine desulfurase family protein [Chitinophagales bacterium]